MKITIIKVGGAVVEDSAQLAALLEGFKKVEGYKILVHGGGRRATKVAAQLGIESKMVGGRRITDAEMLEVVTMVYGGLVNKNIVAQLQSLGINAIGLTGADMDVIRSHKRPLKDGVDFGFVGDVDKVNAERLKTLIDAGMTPVLAPLTHDSAGTMLNTNAVHISVKDGSYSIDHIFDGETVEEVLDYVQYNPKKLVRQLEIWVTKSVKAGKISLEEGKEFLSNYRSGLYGYTYLE